MADINKPSPNHRPYQVIRRLRLTTEQADALKTIGVTELFEVEQSFGNLAVASIATWHSDDLVLLDTNDVLVVR